MFCLPSVCTSHLIEVFVSLAFSESSSFCAEMAPTHPEIALHLSLVWLFFRASIPAWHCSLHGCVSGVAGASDPRGQRPRLSTAVCPSPSTQQVLNKCDVPVRADGGDAVRKGWWSSAQSWTPASSLSLGFPGTRSPCSVPVNSDTQAWCALRGCHLRACWVTSVVFGLWPYDPMDCSPPGSCIHGDSPGKNTGAGCHALLQGIFLTQGSNPSLLRLLHWQAGSFP